MELYKGLIAVNLFLFPLYWMLTTSVKPEVENIRWPITLWPEAFTLENYRQIFSQPEDTPVFTWFRNSLVAAMGYALMSVGGSMLAQKGESAPAEVHAAEGAIKFLGGEVRQLIPITLPGVVEERHLVVVDKIATTPPGYPRKAGTPTKKPL